MSTTREVVSGALKLLGVRPAESPISDTEAIDGMEALNDMLNEWAVNGLTIDFETVEDLDEKLYVEDGFIGAIKSNLAIYIAPEYNRAVTAELAMRARKGRSVVRATIANDDSAFPDTLPVGSGNEWDNYVADGDTAGNVRNSRFYPANTTPKCN